MSGSLTTSEKDEMADMIADNRIQQQSILDLSECLEIIDDFNMGDFDCEQFGFLLEDYENYMNIPHAFDSPDRYTKPKEEESKQGEESQGKERNNEQEKEKPRAVYMVCPQCGFEIKRGI